MNQETKKLLTANSMNRIQELFPNSDDSFAKFAKTIAEISVKSTITVLEEYEKIKEAP